MICRANRGGSGEWPEPVIKMPLSTVLLYEGLGYFIVKFWSRTEKIQVSRKWPRPLLQRGNLGAARSAVLASVLALAACSEVSPQYDPVEWGTAVRNEVGGWFGAEPVRIVRDEPPPAEGRPYPNLATVPKPPVVTPSGERQQEIERLSRDRTSARTPAPPTGATAPGAPASSLVGRVSLPATPGRFSDADRAILQQAVTAAATSRNGLRLVGAPEATSAVATELGQLGLPPNLARRETGPGGRQVEIFVDY
jgi:hypothetical protein